MVRATPAARVEPARPGARARRDSTGTRAASPGGRPGLARAADGPGAPGLTRNESQSMYFHKGNHGLSGAGPAYLYVILSNAQPEAPPAGRAAASAAAFAGPGRASPGAEAAFLLLEKQV